MPIYVGNLGGHEAGVGAVHQRRTVLGGGIMTGFCIAHLRRTARLWGVALGLAALVAAGPALAQRAYITNLASGYVTTIDTTTNAVVGVGIATPGGPTGVAVSPDGTRVYVANQFGDSVSVLDTATNTVIGAAIPVGTNPSGVAVTPNGARVYVTNINSANVSVIDTATNTVIGAPIPVGTTPFGVAVTPNGARVYVANSDSDTVSVIDTATSTVIGAPIAVGLTPLRPGCVARRRARLCRQPGRSHRFGDRHGDRHGDRRPHWGGQSAYRLRPVHRARRPARRPGADPVRMGDDPAGPDAGERRSSLPPASADDGLIVGASRQAGRA